MAWNRSHSTKGAGAVRAQAKATVFRSVKSVAIVMSIVGISTVVYFLLHGQNAPSTIVERAEWPKRTIAEATSAVGARPMAVKQPPKRYEDMSDSEKLASIRAKYGENIPENMKAIVYYLEHPPKQVYHPARSRESIFKHESERVIASFVTTEPGTWFMRQPTFDERIDADFSKAMSEEIKIADSDNPEEAELKRLVIDAKAELSERIAAGEKVSDILNAVGREYYELGQFRRNLQSELTRFKRDSQYTDQDVQELVEAANKMLAKKGLPPMKMPRMIFRHLSLKRAAAKARTEGR